MDDCELAKRRISILDIEGVWHRTTTLNSIHKATSWVVFFLFFLLYMHIIEGLYLVSALGWRRVKMLRIMLFGGACDKYICVEWTLDNFDLGFKPRPNKVAWQLVMVAILIDLARGLWDVSKLDGLIMTTDLVLQWLQKNCHC